MGGDYSASSQWISDYDEVATKWISTGTLLADALTRYGDVLAGMGYNWDISNQTIPYPDRPMESAPIGNPYTLTHTAKGDNGHGIEIRGVGTSKIEPIPNGHIYKLLNARDQAWLHCAMHPDILDARDRIEKIGYNFDHSSEDNIEDIREKLRTLRDAAGGIADASRVIKGAVAEYHATLEGLRTSIKDRLESAVSSVKVTIDPTAVVVTCAAPIFSKDLEDPVYFTVSVSDFVVAVSSRPFTSVPDLDFYARELGIIAALPVLLIEDDAGSGGDTGSGGDVPAPLLTKESEKYVRDKHFPGGVLNTNAKSTFNADENPYALVAAAAASPAIDQGDGTYRREVVVPDRFIGNESAMRGGSPTQTYIVVHDRFGAVITMYPTGNDE